MGRDFMTSADNLEIARNFHSCVLDGYESLMSEDFIGHDILGHDWDREFQVKGLKEDITAFDNLHDMIHDIFTDGDKVALRFTRSGIFNQKFENYEPSHKTVNFKVMEIMHISEGKIVEIWCYNDDEQVDRILKGEDE